MPVTLAAVGGDAAPLPSLVPRDPGGMGKIGWGSRGLGGDGGLAAAGVVAGDDAFRVREVGLE